CDFPCGGDDTLTCGGAGAISIFQNLNEGVGPVPTNKAQVGTWVFDGCFTDAIDGNGRTLLERFDIAEGVTIESCTAQCEATGFNITGLEFGQECWCGSSFLVANTTAPLTDCSRACEADHTELCGAASRLSVYLNEPVVIPPTTVAPTTVKPTTVVPTTVVPTTVAPTTVKPTTVVPTIVVPTTVVPTTVVPTTVVPTTVTKAGPLQGIPAPH
ncbi:WSC domain-containing protein, partial [Flammula alnicola]